MRLKPFQVIYPELDYITSSDSYFKGLKLDYTQFRTSGLFNGVQSPGYYIYRIRSGDHEFLGVVGLADLADYTEGRIKAHENTLAEKEQIHLNLLLKNRAMLKPVLLTHKPVPQLTDFLKSWVSSHTPHFFLHFDSEGVDHEWWFIDDDFSNAFIESIYAEQVKESYIADGHHRSSAVKLLNGLKAQHTELRGMDGILVAFFSADQVEIHDFNRIVDVFADISPTRFIAELSRFAEIVPLDQEEKPKEKFVMTMYLHKEWYKLRWRDSLLAQYDSGSVVLDSQLFDDIILKEILMVRDIRTDGRIQYFPGVWGLEAFKHAVNEKEIRVGFNLYPASLDEMMVISDNNNVLPPKSTWFNPRLKNGILVYEF